MQKTWPRPWIEIPGKEGSTTVVVVVAAAVVSSGCGRVRGLSHGRGRCRNK